MTGRATPVSRSTVPLRSAHESAAQRFAGAGGPATGALWTFADPGPAVLGASEDPALAAPRIQFCPAGSDLLTALLAVLIACSAQEHGYRVNTRTGPGACAGMTLARSSIPSACPPPSQAAGGTAADRPTTGHRTRTAASCRPCHGAGTGL